MSWTNARNDIPGKLFTSTGGLTLLTQAVSVQVTSFLMTISILSRRYRWRVAYSRCISLKPDWRFPVCKCSQTFPSRVGHFMKIRHETLIWSMTPVLPQSLSLKHVRRASPSTCSYLAINHTARTRAGARGICKTWGEVLIKGSGEVRSQGDSALRAAAGPIYRRPDAHGHQARRTRSSSQQAGAHDQRQTQKYHI